MADHFYTTLDEALKDVAKRSFYEDCNVVPCAPITGLGTGQIVGYLVSDDTSYATDEWVWTYAGGIADRDSVNETTRLFDAPEFWNCAEHVRNGLPDSVEYLESGKGSVTFAYAIVEDGDSVNDEETDYAGWIALAIHYDLA